jgi:glycosyltransferase involved in cell wall biosynthesis
MRTVLFVSHDASLSGAPIVLLDFVKWVKKSQTVTPLVLLIGGGPLECEFENVCPTWSITNFHTNHTLVDKVYGFFQKEAKKRRYIKRVFKEIKSYNPDLCYLNTIVTCKIVLDLKRNLGLSLMMHVHEMKFSAETYYSDIAKPEIFLEIDKFIAVSNNVEEYLIKNMGVHHANIKVIPPFRRFDDVNYLKSPNVEFDFTIGFSGYGSWRKGFFLLTLLMKEVQKKLKEDRKFRFLWMGDVSELDIKQTRYLLEKLGNSFCLEVTGHVENTSKYYQEMDVFVMLSVEDPFPLVCIEAGLFSLPILCFEGAGGANDFIKNGGGISVPFLDLTLMADVIINLSYEDAKVACLGQIAKSTSALHDIEIIAPRICTEINAFQL